MHLFRAPQRQPAGQRPWSLLPFALAGLLAATPIAAAVGPTTTDPDTAAYAFDDSPRDSLLHYPDWFNPPFLDLRADHAAAVAAGKTLVVYFGQRRCAYCHQLMDVNFALPDIVEYTRHHFAVTPIDIWGIHEVTDLDGTVLTERDLALREETNFTPSLLFYDASGRPVFRLRGYYPPYQFRAALEYAADAHYERESFAEYLARGDNRMVFDATDLNAQPFFQPPPYQLDRSRIPGDRPLVVFFEQGDCHACDVLHGQVLREPTIAGQFREFDSIQLDLWSDTPVVTPDGTRTSARAWAEDLGLFYAPTLLFFDEGGHELLRLDSVLGFHRLRNVLNYIGSRAYLTEPDYRRWRMTHGF
ncbi:MAG: thioredoxin [Chromatiaceae bacterium]|nr:MAG: thioredoxin [Chromatiaceae bacterium]